MLFECKMCQGELQQIGGMRRSGGVYVTQTTCPYCYAAWTITESETSAILVEPTDMNTEKRYEAYKRGCAIEAALNVERLIKLGNAEP